MDKDRIGELLSKARAEYGPPWPPALTRYLEGGEEGPVPEKVLEELQFLDAVHGVPGPRPDPVFRPGL